MGLLLCVVKAYAQYNYRAGAKGGRAPWSELNRHLQTEFFQAKLLTRAQTQTINSPPLCNCCGSKHTPDGTVEAGGA
jgi:hypothetical protein